MIALQDIWSAVDIGYEEIANQQLDIAFRSRISGDITVYNKAQLKSVKLLAYITAIAEIPFNNNSNDNATLEKLYNNIKSLTKDLRRWD